MFYTGNFVLSASLARDVHGLDRLFGISYFVPAGLVNFVEQSSVMIYTSVTSTMDLCCRNIETTAAQANLHRKSRRSIFRKVAELKRAVTFLKTANPRGLSAMAIARAEETF